MNFTTWRKSSYSSNTNAQCVEIGLAPGLVGVRDTKDRERGNLAISRTAWKTFIRSVTR